MGHHPLHGYWSGLCWHIGQEGEDVTDEEGEFQLCGSGGSIWSLGGEHLIVVSLW